MNLEITSSGKDSAEEADSRKDVSRGIMISSLRHLANCIKRGKFSGVVGVVDKQKASVMALNVSEDELEESLEALMNHCAKNLIKIKEEKNETKIFK